MAIATLTIDILAKLAGLERDMGRAAHIAEVNARKIDSAFSAAGRSISAIGSALSVGLFANLIKGALDAQDNLKDLSKSTSISIEDLSGLGSAALKSGSDLDSIASSINKLSQNMGKDAEKFKAIGITAKDPIEAFKQLADVFNAIQDPQERAAFAAEALGKSWQGAAPLLAEGSKSIGEMVEKGKDLSKITAESAAKADELNDVLIDLQTASSSLTTKFANELAPSLLDTAKAMDDMVTKGSPLLALLRGFAGLGKIPFDLALGDIDASIGGQIKDLESQLKSLQDKREAYNPFVPWGDSLKEIDQKILVTKNQLEGLKKYGDQIGKGPASKDAPLSGSVVSPDVQSFISPPKPTKSGGGGRKPAAETVKELTASTRDYQAAMESLSSTLLRAESASLNFDDAQEALHKLMTGSEWETYPEAMKWAAIEQASFASAALSAADAQKTLNDLLSDTPTGQLDAAAEKLVILADAYNAAVISAEQLDEATQEVLKSVGQGSEEATDKLDKQKTVAEELGLTFSSAFEDAIVKGEEFSDVLDGIYKDILRIIVRKNITEPMAGAIGKLDFSSLFSGFSLPSFAVGTDYVPQDMIAQIHKGEKIVPAKYNNDSSGVSVVINNSMADQAQATVQPRMNNGKLELEVLIQQVLSKDMQQNGRITQGLSNTFGLARAV